MNSSLGNVYHTRPSNATQATKSSREKRNPYLPRYNEGTTLHNVSPTADRRARTTMSARTYTRNPSDRHTRCKLQRCGRRRVAQCNENRPPATGSPTSGVGSRPEIRYCIDCIDALKRQFWGIRCNLLSAMMALQPAQEGAR